MTRKVKPTAPIKASTQDFVEIEAVKDDILMFKDNSCCIIIAAGTTNFDLLSKEEQLSIINDYASLLNSLSFPIQISILSKRTSIVSYLDKLDEKIRVQNSEVLRNRLINYADFIKNLIKQNAVLEKNYYFVIPFFALELGIKTKVTKEYVITRAKTSLYPKKDHLLRLLKKSGLGGKVLKDQEIIELFYTLYNPASPSLKLSSMESYTSVLSVGSEKINLSSTDLSGEEPKEKDSNINISSHDAGFT